MRLMPFNVSSFFETQETEPELNLEQQDRATPTTVIIVGIVEEEWNIRRVGRADWFYA